MNVAYSNLDFETPMTGFSFSQDVEHHGFELFSPSTATALNLNSESPSKETNTCFRPINNALKDYDLENKVRGDKPAALEAGTGRDFINNPSLGKDVSVVFVAGLSSSEAEARTESCESEGTVLCPLERVNADCMTCLKDLINSRTVSCIAPMLTQDTNVPDSSPTPRVAEAPRDLTHVPEFRVEAAVTQPAPVLVPATRVRAAVGPAISCTLFYISGGSGWHLV